MEVEGRGEERRNQTEVSSKRTKRGDKVLKRAQRGDKGKQRCRLNGRSKKFKFTDAVSEPELHYRMVLVFVVLPLEL